MGFREVLECLEQKVLLDSLVFLALLDPLELLEWWDHLDRLE